MSTKIKATWHNDAGHAWLEVRAVEVRALEIAVSAYSYHDPGAGLVYLEEDCDAIKFLEAHEAAGHAMPTSFPEVYDGDHSPIRDLPRYR